MMLAMEAIPRGLAAITQAKTMVVKVGSAVLTDSERGGLDGAVFLDLVQSLADLAQEGRRVVLVTSGAVLSGMMALGLKERPRLLPEKQACAAIGQIELMARYRSLFEARGVRVGQILLTADDFRDRQRFLNARNTILTLLERGVVPIINENDTVSVDEIKLGDNDNLSSLVINLIGADLLLLLSDVDGLYTGDPKTNREAKRIPRLVDGAPELVELGKGPSAGIGSGGIATKLAAVRKAMALGVPAAIACGKVRGIIRAVLAGQDVGTQFVPGPDALTRKKHWMAFAPKPRGRILLDAGAVKAVTTGNKSLLPSGVRGVEGEFEMGDLVSLVGPDSLELARGLASYPSQEIRRIQGVHSSQIEKILGHKDFDEVVHRDNLVLTVTAE
jgi:glutamate 5-kinase